MKKITLLFAIILSAIVAFAQWEWQNPLPQGNSLYDVEFIDENTGWAVGYYGTLLSSENGGENWEIQPTGIKESLNSICFIDSRYAWITGENGLILHTDNSGLNWVEQNCGTTKNLNDCCFLNSNLGYIVGDSGLILKTEDEGNSWYTVESPTDLPLIRMCFTDSLNGWILATDIYFSESIILHTIDGGNNWFEQFSFATLTSFLTSIYFTDPLHGWAVGAFYNEYYPTGIQSEIFHTSDGGTSWENQESWYPGMFTSVCFKDSLNGWAAGGESYFSSGNYGFILKTSDGGESWTNSEQLNSEVRINNLCFLDNDTGFFVGETGIIFATYDGGNSLTELSSAANRNYLQDVYFNDPFNGWIVGAEYASAYGSKGIILKSEDEGVTWNDIAPDSVLALNTICGYEESIWAAGGYYVHFGATYLGYIYFSDDNGNSWTQQYYNNIGNLNSIFFADDQTGWASGGKNSSSSFSGIILQTTNGGNEWTLQFTDSLNVFNSTFFINNDIGWTVGTNGTIYQTDNAGSNWTMQESGTNLDLFKVVFTSPEKGWIVGSWDNFDIILSTTNGGETWQESISGEGWGLHNIHFSDAINGWAVGDRSILFTKNGGNSWEVFDAAPTNGLSSVWFTDSNNGWIVGSGGKILHTSNGGTTGFNNINFRDQEPQLQCYPNPFTTSTTIEYELTKPSAVQLVIYDYLGKQVYLIEKNQAQGKQQLIWNAEGLPAGVYFCVLKTNQGRQTAKLIKLNY